MYWCFINTHGGDEASKLATTLEVPQVIFFRAMLQECIRQAPVYVCIALYARAQ